MKALVSGNRKTFIYAVDNVFIDEWSLVFENDDPDYTQTGKRLYLSRVIVKETHRNQGIGSMILDYLITHTKKLGDKEISIGVDTDHIVARRLYEKKGFTRVIFEGRDENGAYVKLLHTLD